MSTGRKRRGTVPRPSPARKELLGLRDTVCGAPRPARAPAGLPARARPKGARAAAVAGLARFGIVGVSGIAVNEAAIAVLVSVLGLHAVVGYLLATQFSTLWNFAFIETWAFKHASPTNRRWQRFVMLVVVNNIANVLTAPLFVVFTSVLGINYLISNILTLSVVFVARFVVADRIWGGVMGRATESNACTGDSNTAAHLLKLHDDSAAAARTGARRFATPHSRRALHEALVTEQMALRRLGFRSFAEFRSEPDRAETERMIAELRARVADLETELAEILRAVSDALGPVADDGVEWLANMSSGHREDGAQRASIAPKGARRKWFPTA